MTSKREELIEKARAAIKSSDSIELVRAFEYLAAEQSHTPKAATEKDRANLDRLRETYAGSTPAEVRGEAVVNHRVGFWNISDPYDPEVTTEMIALADEELERYVQQRIAEFHTPTNDERNALEEALKYLDDLNADRQIWYDDYSRLHDLISSALHCPAQGEPTEASECEYCGGVAWHHTVACFTGEPTDAEVLAALNAYGPESATDDLSNYHPINVAAMRAALRAAFATEQGGNR